MTQNPTSNTIEPWQLTAYALNELDPNDTARVELALESDAALRIEFDQIQQTLTAVRSALASTAASVTLSENQSATVANQIKQVVAPKNATTKIAAATVKLAERPFYRRKRFAALLATAAAIPLAVTWMPTLFENGGPFAVNVAGQALPSSSYLNRDVQYFPESAGSRNADLKTDIVQPKDELSIAHAARKQIAEEKETDYAESNQPASIVPSNDAITAGSGLIGDVDLSFVPEMGLVIIKGGKGDVQRVQEVVDGIKKNEGIVGNAAIESAERRIRVNEATDVAKNDSMPSAPSSSPGAAGSGMDTTPFDRIDSVAELKKQASEKDATIVETKVGVSDGGTILLGDIKREREKLNPAPGEQAPGKANISKLSSGLTPRIIVSDAEEALGSVANSIDGKLSENRGVGGGGGASGLSGGGMRLGVPTASDPKLAVAESLSFHDKRLRDTDSFQLERIPEELRQNAPHLFRAVAPEKSGTDRFEKIVETPFVETQKAPLSTFSIDVDTASYSKIRQTLMESQRLPSPSMVRIEEMVNYFEYGYAGPQDERPFAAHMTVDRCPWNSEHQLVRVGLQAKKLETDKRVKANIVFLLDVSGSMNEPNKLPLVKKALSMMVNQLTENDRVAIVVYAGAAGCVLPSICGAEKQAILSSLDHLNAGGSTNGGQGIQLAYSIAKEHFIPGGANRVVLCTDGDFNVGVTGDDALVAMMQENAKSNIFLTCLGFGAGNYNDTMMEKISNKGNGIYGMIDNELEARRMMVEQLSGTLVTVAKDVKIQVDFNPAKVAGYRLIGYEDRRLANKDFANDQKDAGEIGAGHRVTALYEVIPAGKWVGVVPPSDSESSKYLQKQKTETKFETPAAGEFSAEVLTLKVRYKEPEGSVSSLQEFVLKDTERDDKPLVDRDMQWATSVAEFGLLLRRSQMAPQADWTEMLERASSAAGGDPYRLECLAMMRKAKSLIQ